MKPALQSQPSDSSHRRLVPVVAAILIATLASNTRLGAQDVGDYKVGEVVEYRIGDTDPFMVKITRIDAGGIYAEFVESGVKLGQYCEVSSLRRSGAAQPAAAVPAGEGVMSEADFLQLVETRLGPEPPVNADRERIFKELEAEIKARGVDFRIVPLSEFRKKLYALKCPASIAPTLHDNFGPPGTQAELLGTWIFIKIGGKVDYDKDDKRFRDNESAAEGAGALTLNADNSYSWQVPTMPAVEGTWRAATGAEMRFQGGDGVVLLKAKAGWDWIVVKDRITVPEGDRILAAELKTRQVKEHGRR